MDRGSPEQQSHKQQSGPDYREDRDSTVGLVDTVRFVRSLSGWSLRKVHALGHDIPWMPDQPFPWLPGAAYGAFLLERYTRWKNATGELDLYYLMSTGSPYQVQLMHTTLRLGVRIPEWLTKEEVERGDEMGGMERPSAEELGLIVMFGILQREPGFEHEQVVSISPPAGTLVRPGSTVTVTINLEG